MMPCEDALIGDEDCIAEAGKGQTLYYSILVQF